MSSPLLFAHILDGRGGSREIDAPEVLTWAESDGPLWIHVDLAQPGTTEWLSSLPGVDEDVLAALVAEDTRPRTLHLDDGILMNLRSVNRGEDADPEDMIAIRLWIQSHCIISARRRAMRSPSVLAAELARGRGPSTMGELLVSFTGMLARLVEPVLDELEDHADDLEERILVEAPRELQSPLAQCRQTVIRLRRFLHPQSHAITELNNSPEGWLTPDEHESLQHTADRVTRQVEDLDALRDRAGVVQDQLNSNQSAQLERRMFLVSIIATLFLPLTLVSGLLGANVGGIPLANNEQGFAMVCGLTLLLGAAQYLALRRLKWL